MSSKQIADILGMSIGDVSYYESRNVPKWKYLKRTAYQSQGKRK